MAAPLSALAAEEPQYPSVFREERQFTALNDFAMGGGKNVFADGDKLVVLEGESLSEFDAGGSVTRLDFYDGHFVYTVSGKDYILPDDMSATPAEDTHGHAAYSFEDVTLGGYLYYFDNSGKFMALDKSTNAPSAVFENPVKVKEYGGVIYGVAENVFYSVTGPQASPVKVYYSNFAKLERLPVGSVASALSAYNPSPSFVRVDKGGALTEVDIESLSPLGQDGKPLTPPAYIPVKDIDDTHGGLEGNGLLLCEAGESRIILLGGKTYITSPGNAPTYAQMPIPAATEGTFATANAPERAYALPFACGATIAFEISAGEKLNVVSGLLSKEQIPVLQNDFYIVENGDGQRGYVIADFLEVGKIYDEGGASEVPEPDPQTGNYIKTVILVLVVVILVLITAGYLTWLATSPKRKTSQDVLEDDGATETPSAPEEQAKDEDKKEDGEDKKE